VAGALRAAQAPESAVGEYRRFRRARRPRHPWPLRRLRMERRL